MRRIDSSDAAVRSPRRRSVNAPDPFSKPFLERIQLAGHATGTSIAPIMIRDTVELDAAFQAMLRQRPDALVVQPNLPIKRVAELTLMYRMPAASPFRPFVEDAGLMSYYIAEAEVSRRRAMLVDRVLKGTKPTDLPVEEPTKFELVINLKTAKTLGLTIPPALLGRADQIIE
jgi:putative ABC transport system substrate-binding protein